MMDSNKVKFLIKGSESDKLELKRFEKLQNLNDKKRKDLAILFAALANTQGGHVIFGIKDNKEFQGYELTNEEFKIFEQSLVNIAHDKLSPPINLKEIQKISCEEGDVLLINIPIRKMGNPCSVDGILHMRHGSHNQPVIDSTIRKRLYDENETLIDEKDKVISTNNLEDIEKIGRAHV